MHIIIGCLNLPFSTCYSADDSSKFTSPVVHHIHLMMNITRISALLQNFPILNIYDAAPSRLGLHAPVLIHWYLASWQSLTLLPSRFVILNAFYLHRRHSPRQGESLSDERVWVADFECDSARCNRGDSLIRWILDKDTLFSVAGWGGYGRRWLPSTLLPLRLLDLLNEADFMQILCQIYAIWSKFMPKFMHLMPNLCKKYAQYAKKMYNMQKICKKYVQKNANNKDSTCIIC